MKKLWTRRVIEAPALETWRILTDPAIWPTWGPSVRSATIDGPELGLGVAGTIDTFAGVRLPFEITAFEPGRRWEWRVAGVPATDHVIAALGDHSCEVAFGVPVVAAPYVAVCRVALRRIGMLATETRGVSP